MTGVLAPYHEMQNVGRGAYKVFSSVEKVSKTVENAPLLDPLTS